MANKIGVLIGLGPSTDVAAEFAKLKEMQLECCQLSCHTPAYTDEIAAKVRRAAEETGVEVTAVWAGWSGPAEWNFISGPSTLGLVPPAYREKRMGEVLAGAEFARKIGVSDVITHVGFLPENPDDPNYSGIVACLRYIASQLKARGQYFLFETGQETPITLLRTIEDVGTGNLGVNFDTANLILYGKANPVDALDILGPYVRNTHCKDGFYPTTGRLLGNEVALGQGKANFPALVSRLKDFGYTGPYVIEREISGEQQRLDILAAREFIASLL